MDPTLVVLAFRSAVRLVHAGEAAFGQYARDREALLPVVQAIAFPAADLIRGEFETQPELIRDEIRPYWESFIKKGGARLAGDADVMAAEYARVQARKRPDGKQAPDEITGIWIVTQWSKAATPVGPIARVVLTIVDVAAEFAGQNPAIFGVGGSAEILVQALAMHIAELVPDDTQDLGPRNLLGQKLAGIFLKAGLSALNEHPEAVIENAHVQSLVKSTLPKLIEALPSGLGQVEWRNVVETLLGPVASEALKAVAENPQAFFGRKFADDDLLGALTRTFLLKAADVGIGEIFSRAGAVTIYKSVLKLASRRPELFLGTPADTTGKLVTTLFHDLTATLAESSPPFDEDLVGELAASTLETVAGEGSALLDPDKPWQNVLSVTLTPVLAAISGALKQHDSGALKRLVSGDALKEMVRIVVTQIARTPGMVTSTDNAEVNALVSAVAGAMAQDDNLLLSHDDWMQILAVAAQEVAANPGRLVPKKIGGAARNLLAELLGDLASVAADQWKQRGRAGSVLFGPTLREAMTIALRAAAGNAAAALANRAGLKDLAAKLSDVVAAKPGQFGSKEWLRLYRALIVKVLESGALAKLDDATIRAVLSAGENT
jgi:hypothetical protein